MKRLSTRTVFPFLAAGLVAAVLPLGATTATAVPASAGLSGGVSAKEGVDFGFATEGWASPLQLEIFEPTIPLPASPQAELEFGYSKVEADSGGGKGRASFLWPGDPAGEGAKTVIENLGLPPQLSGPLAAQGYPIQVNSDHPSGPESEANEPFPGTVMRTRAVEGKVTAATGYSNNCDVSEPADGGDGGEGGDSPLPELPGVPGLGGLLGQQSADQQDGQAKGDEAGAGMLSSFGAAITGQQSEDAAAKSAAAEEEAACPLPAQLTTLVDMDGYVSTSSSVVAKGGVTTTTRAALGEVKLLGGIVKLSGITAKAVSGIAKTNTASGKARYGTLTIGPAEFGIGPDGFEGNGQKQEIPGLPDQPKEALKTLGITITVPKPTYETKGMAASSVVEALVVELDTKVLSPVLSQLPLGQLLGPVPFPEEMAPIKSALTAIPGLAPRFVFHFGTASSEVERAPDLDLPDIDPPSDDPTGEDDGDTSGGGSTGTSGGGSGSAGGTPTSPTDAGTAAGDVGGSDSAAPSDGALTDAAPTGAGLPPLNSIPGALLFGGIALAAAAGSYLRKLGALALGSGAACPHGLDSGLPDLRKA